MRFRVEVSGEGPEEKVVDKKAAEPPFHQTDRVREEIEIDLCRYG